MGAVEPVPLVCSNCFTDTEPSIVVLCWLLDVAVAAAGAGVDARVALPRLLLISPACLRTW
jgi:hypothetical protein